MKTYRLEELVGVQPVATKQRFGHSAEKSRNDEEATKDLQQLETLRRRIGGPEDKTQNQIE